MPLYTYKAIDARGKNTIGRTEAVNPFDLEQRLARMGFGHRGVAWIEYGVMLACAAIALSIREASAGVQAGVIAAATAGLVAIAVWIDLRWARHLRTAKPQTGSE